MSERLTTRLANGGVGYDNGEYFKVCYPWNEHCLRSVDRMAIKLCELEDKIEQGNVVEVVRCRDCLFAKKGFDECDIYCKLNDASFGKDAYCSYGERSE